jgi:hypothetical protein
MQHETGRQGGLRRVVHGRNELVRRQRRRSPVNEILYMAPGNRAYARPVKEKPKHCGGSLFPFIWDFI